MYCNLLNNSRNGELHIHIELLYMNYQIVKNRTLISQNSKKII